MFILQARFGISSQFHWSEKDGYFNYHKFYYVAMDLIDKCEDVEWKERLLKHFNMCVSMYLSMTAVYINQYHIRLLFRNEDGQTSDLMAKDDDSAPTSTSKKESSSVACERRWLCLLPTPSSHPLSESSLMIHLQWNDQHSLRALAVQVVTIWVDW